MRETIPRYFNFDPKDSIARRRNKSLNFLKKAIKNLSLCDLTLVSNSQNTNMHFDAQMVEDWIDIYLRWKHHNDKSFTYLGKHKETNRWRCIPATLHGFMREVEDLLVEYPYLKKAKFLELGCGPLVKCKLLSEVKGFDCLGIEIDEQWVKLAQPLESPKCRIRKEDILLTKEIPKHDIIYTYEPVGDEIFMEELIAKIAHEMKEGAALLIFRGEIELFSIIRDFPALKRIGSCTYIKQGKEKS